MQRDPLIVGNIVGDIVDYFDASARLRFFYGNREITIGSELRPSHVANQPTVQITGLSGSLYTLVSDHFYLCSIILEVTEVHI
jgi:protein FLOWERING LOCUS T